MNLITVLGLVAGAITAFSFLPQAVKCWKTHQTKDISLPASMFLSLGIFLWIVYGLLIRDLPLIIANVIGLTFILMILTAKLKFG